MRLVSLLLALLIIGWLVKQQLDSAASTTGQEPVMANETLTVPAVPTAPGGVKTFGKEMSGFIQGAADQREKQIAETLDK